MKRLSASAFKTNFLARALHLAGIAVVAALGAVTGCGGSDSNSPGTALPLKNMNTTMTKHSDVLKATLRRNTIYKPALDLFNNASDGEKIGIFVIPHIGITERIIEGTTDADLAMGGGHLVNTGLPGMGSNFVVAGDRVLYSAPLLRAEQLQPGDEIRVEMPYGKFIYKVENLTTIDPEDTSILTPKGYDTIMLSTCDPLWQIDTRIIVSAKLVEAEATV